MTAEALEKLEPGTPAWLRLITASKVAAILGVSTYDSPRSMWHKMRNELPEEPQKDEQARGHYVEPGILNWWEDKHEIRITETPDSDYQPVFRLEDWAAATPDAVVVLPDEGRVLVEAKSARDLDEWGAPGTDQIPTQYLVQSHWQLHVANRAGHQISKCYVPILGAFLDFEEYLVTYDPEIGNALEAKCRDFLASLINDQPPVIDDHKATYNALRKLYRQIDDSTVDLDPRMAIEYLDAKNAAKAAEANERLQSSRVLEAMGTNRYGEVDGVRVCRRQANRTGFQLNQVAKTSADIAHTVMGEGK